VGSLKILLGGKTSRVRYSRQELQYKRNWEARSESELWQPALANRASESLGVDPEALCGLSLGVRPVLHNLLALLWVRARYVQTSKGSQPRLQDIYRIRRILVRC